MTSKLKCPFCQQELECLAEDIYGNMYCPDCRDKNGFTYKASESIWQELIRTRKALDVAVNELKRIDETRSSVKEKLHATNCRTLNAGNGFCWATIDDIHNALEQITALTKGGNNE